MPSFGSWITEPDWHYLDTYFIEDNPTRYTPMTRSEVQGEVHHHEENGDEPGPPRIVTMGDITILLNDAKEANHFRYGKIRYVWDYKLSYPYWTTEWRAQVFDLTWDVSPPTQGFFFTEGVPDPEDAIGIEYEGRGWNPDDPWSHDVDTVLHEEGIVAAHLGYVNNDGVGSTETLFTVDREDDSDPFENPSKHLIGGWTTDVTLAVGAGDITVVTMEGAPDQSTQPAHLPAPHRFDMTEALRDNGWSGLLFCKTDDLVPPFRDMGMEPTMSGLVRYGFELSRVEIDWTVKAIPYRWVYASTPYRRNFPRDDGLAGGARRNYPPSRAIQTGNRNVGGYL